MSRPGSDTATRSALPAPHRLVCLVLVLGIAVSPAVRAQQAAVDSSPAIGIGSIVHTADYTTESFAIADFLSKNPVAVGGRSLPVRLVDHPREATWVVSGRIDGHIRTVSPKGYWHLEADNVAHILVWERGRRSTELTFACPGRSKDTVMGSYWQNARYDVVERCLRDLKSRLQEFVAAAHVDAPRGGR